MSDNDDLEGCGCVIVLLLLIIVVFLIEILEKL